MRLLIAAAQINRPSEIYCSRQKSFSDGLKGRSRATAAKGKPFKRRRQARFMSGAITIQSPSKEPQLNARVYCFTAAVVPAAATVNGHICLPRCRNLLPLLIHPRGAARGTVPHSAADEGSALAGAHARRQATSLSGLWPRAS